MTKTIRTKCVIDEFHFENEAGEYLDVKISMEGYIELDMETSKKFTIESQDELDLIYKNLSEALKSVKS